MKINKKRLLYAAAMLIVFGAAIFGIGRAIFSSNEGGYSMENQSYALSDIKSIQIGTDAPSVMIKPVSGDQINLTWETGDYIEYSVELKGGELTIDYRISTNWLRALFLTPLVRNDYVLEVELPDGYQGGLTIHTASGAIGVDTGADLEDVNLKTVSGKIDAAGIASRNGIELRSTSGSVSLEAAEAGGDIHLQTVSGSVGLVKSGAQGGVTFQTASGSMTVTEVNASERMEGKSVSGRIEVSQTQCDQNVSMESTSGKLKLSDIGCKSFYAKTVSGGIDMQGLTADSIEMRSTSGSIHGTVNGNRGDYGISVQTVSGGSNLGNSPGGSGKTLKLHTVSGSIDVGFSGE